MTNHLARALEKLDDLTDTAKGLEKIEDGTSLPSGPIELEDVFHYVDDMSPGSPAHKAQRWDDYLEREGEWDFDRWSKQYDTNMKNYKHGLGREADYRKILGGTSKMEKTKFTYRQIDIYKPDEMYMGQLKTGKVYHTTQAKIDIKKDAWLVNEGYKVEYILEDGASKPFIEALNNNGIDYKIGSQIP